MQASGQASVKGAAFVRNAGVRNEVLFYIISSVLLAEWPFRMNGGI
ncbi:hypothetical protein NSU_3301 [Novosphingobium pentaromativorans US6-1]|uniref:Uncharacterized protein n=1 Tax=Novosphingobium pentaromativorans US6-1 TaxID=1088721 RepID=G6EG30_9SPHN|nr:hypothetical protein NSU_3301 [Novosphingobium pentaromativorans US6-1]